MNWIKKFAPNINVLLVAILLVGLLAVFIPGPSVYAWYSDYQYSQMMELSRASGTVSDYVMEVLVHKGSGSSSGKEVYLENHSESWPNDVRFTTVGNTTLDYGMVFSNTTTAKFYVEFDSIGTSATNFYIYYGKSGDSYAGDLSTVGTFGDDFNRTNGALGGTWTKGTNTDAVIESNRMKWDFTSGDAPPEGVFQALTFSSNLTTHTYAQAPDLENTEGYAFLLADEAASSDAGLWGIGFINNAGTLNTQVLKTGGWSTVGTYTVGTNYTFEIKYDDSTRKATLFIDGSAVATDVAGLTAGDWSSHNNKIAFTGALAATVYSYHDSVFAREWVSPEPAWGSWGAESGGPPTVSTSAATGVGINASTLHGNITSTDPGGSCTQRGFEWGTTSGVYSDNWTQAGTYGTGTFSHTEETFIADTLYYYRAMALNPNGWGYGSEVSFTTLPSGGTPGWLSGYNYRKQVDISGSSSPLSDYIMSLTIMQETGTNDYQGFLASLPFTRRAGPFLAPSGIPGTYDSCGLEYNFVIDDPNNPNQLLMYYAPGSLTAPKSEYAAVATSPKGSDVWTKYSGNPIITPAGTGLRSSSPVYYDGTFYVYYSDTVPTSGAYVATSTDGFTFTKYDGGACILAGGGVPYVTKLGATWYMYYGSSHSGGVRVATSTNGLVWSDVGVVLSVGGGSYWGEAKSVYLIGSTYVMIYDAFTSPAAPWLNMATCSSPTGSFTNYSGNPIFSPAASGWDSVGVTTGALYWDEANSRWDLYYNGCDNPVVFRPSAYGVAHTSSFEDSGSTVYLNDHSLNWPDDIRFTKSDGTTLLEYATDEGTGGICHAEIEVASVPTSGTSIYLYYGRSGGPNGETLTPSYVWSDDFNRANSDTVGEGWIEQGTTDGDIVSNQLQVYGAGADIVTNHFRHAITLNQDLSISIKAQGPALGINTFCAWHLIDESPSNHGDWGIQFMRQPDTGTYLITIQDDIDGNTWPTSAGSWAPGVWYTFKMRYDNSTRNVTFLVNDVVIITQSGASNAAWNPYANNVVLGGYSYNWYIDDVIAQVLADPEPAFTIWYAEEAYGAPTVVTGTAASITTSGATSQGTLTSMGGQSAVYVFFQHGTTLSYELGSTTEQAMTTTGGFTEPLTNLNPNTLYYFRAVGRYGVSTYTYGSPATFTTLSGLTPGAPINFGASSTSTQINLSWIKGTGATRTMVRYSTDTYPTTITSGQQIYFGTESSCTFPSAQEGVIYYFSAWSEASGVYSLNYAPTTGKLGVPGELLPPGGFDIDVVKVFRDYDVAGDLLIVMSLKELYPEMPAEDIKECMMIRVLEGTTIRAQGVPTQWGYRPAAIYQAPGHPLVWGADYLVELKGKGDVWAEDPDIWVTSHALRGSSWVGSVAGDTTLLENWILDTAYRMEAYYSATDYPVDLITTSAGGAVLTDLGGEWFSLAIPGLREKLPHLFASGVSGIEGREIGEVVYQGEDIEDAWGSETAQALQGLGESIGFGAEATGGILWIIFIIILVGVVSVKVDPAIGFTISLPLIGVGAGLGFLDLGDFIPVLVALFVLAMFVYFVRGKVSA